MGATCSVYTSFCQQSGTRLLMLTHFAVQFPLHFLKMFTEMLEAGDDVCTTPGRDASTASVRSINRKATRASYSKKQKGMPTQLVRFQINLDQPDPIYFPGEELKGHVYIHVNDDLPVQGIILRIVGEAYVNVANEPRPWTAAKRLGKLKKSFKTKKMPNSMSNHSNISDSFFYRDQDLATSPETTTTALPSMPTSQHSTLQRDQPQSFPSKTTHPRPNAKGKPPQSDETNFRAHEKYFEHKVYVFGHRYSSTREVMWKGKHHFDFSYSLPSKLPVSFHGKFGYVRYFCEASLERHNQPTVQRKAFFSVSTIMDLNLDAKADTGAEKEKKTNSWCFCCPSGTIIVSAKIKKRGFVPGEMIPLQAYVFNVSNKIVHKITARIIQIATYFSSKGFRKWSDETIICEKTENTLPPGESTWWDDVGPCVPPCPPSSAMIDCKLITIDYRLEFVLDIHKAKEPLILRMPLRIGTIPMEKSFKNLMDPLVALDFSENRSSFPLSVCAKYPKLPAVYSLKCIKGDRNVNRYYFKQIPRSMHSMLGVSTRVPAQPTLFDEDEVFAPRYLTFMMCPEQLKELPSEAMQNQETPYKYDKKILENGNAGSAVGNHLIIRVSPPSNRKQTDVILTNGTDKVISKIGDYTTPLEAHGGALPVVMGNGGPISRAAISPLSPSPPLLVEPLAHDALEDLPALLSNSSSVIPSSLCSPTSFRSHPDEVSMTPIGKRMELSQRLASIGATWEPNHCQLRRRSQSLYRKTDLDNNNICELSQTKKDN